MNSVQLSWLLARGMHQLRRVSSCGQCQLASRLLKPNSNCASVDRMLTGSGRRQGVEVTRGGGLWGKIKFDLGFITGLQYPKAVLNLSGFRLYICCTELVDHQQFFKELTMPDTFNSWFLVTDLHVWLSMVRLAHLGKDGRLLRNCLVKALWEDVEARSKQLGEAASLTARKEGVRQLADLFHASLFAYDEGLLGNDQVLAGAVWRIFFGMDQDVDPAHIELVVSYIRKQVAHIDQQEEAAILSRGVMTFLPLKGEEIDQQGAQRQALTIGRLRTRV